MIYVCGNVTFGVLTEIFNKIKWQQANKMLQDKSLSWVYILQHIMEPAI